MFTYNIEINEAKTATKHSWMAGDYILNIVKHVDRATHYNVDNLSDGPEIYVNNFTEEHEVMVNWSALGNRTADEAREYAAKIDLAAEVAEQFQAIVAAF